MAKVFYDRLNKVNLTPLRNVKTGDVVKWDDDLYIVTNSYEDVKGETCYRKIMNITNHVDFGTIEYVDENTNIEVVEDAEITIKY